MLILGIDSGIEKTGFSIFRSGSTPEYVTSGLIKTKPNLELPDRLKIIYDRLDHIVKKNRINLIVLEQLFFFKNQKTVIAVSQSQGVVLLIAAQQKIKTAFLTPLQIKQTITGYGTADKKSLQKMLKMLLPNKITFSDDDESDAVACGLAYCYLNANNLK